MCSVSAAGISGTNWLMPGWAVGVRMRAWQAHVAGAGQARVAGAGQARG